MISTSPEYRYLRDVLGLEAFVRPEGQQYAPVALVSAPTASAQSQSANVTSGGAILVVADKNLSATESELLKKMLSSIKIERFEVVVGDQASGHGANESAAGIIFISSTDTFAATASQPSVQIKNFYAMTSDEAHPSETMAYKKAAWAELQNFKKKING